MKHIAVLMLLLAIIPTVLAVQSQMHDAAMQTNFVTQGALSARAQGTNHNDVPVSILNWKMTAELGPLYSFCELQPVSLPPGPFDVHLTANCQTRSGFTTMYTSGTKVKIETFVPDAAYQQPFGIEKIWLETGPKLPTPFPTAYAVISSENTGRAATAMLFLGIGAIVLLSVLVLIFSRK